MSSGNNSSPDPGCLSTMGATSTVRFPFVLGETNCSVDMNSAETALISLWHISVMSLSRPGLSTPREMRPGSSVKRYASKL